LEQTGFLVRREIFIPFPFASLGFSARTAAVLEKINMLFIRLRPRLFAYQVVLEALPLATPTAALEETIKSELSIAPRRDGSFHTSAGNLSKRTEPAN